jgi:RNA polymerase sigma-70 factor (ECF subfamily)
VAAPRLGGGPYACGCDQTPGSTAPSAWRAADGAPRSLAQPATAAHSTASVDGALALILLRRSTRAGLRGAGPRIEPAPPSVSRQPCGNRSIEAFSPPCHLPERTVHPKDATLELRTADPPTAEGLALDELSRLYREHASLVRSAVVRLAGPGTDVDDLVQDVFLIALERRASFAQRSASTTWLYGIAVRVVSTARRRARLRRCLRLDAAAEPVDHNTPATRFEHREASRTVYRILDGLTEKRRAVFILYELEGLSGEAIAAAVGCPLKTVWTRLHHARRDFQRRLDELEARRP